MIAGKQPAPQWLDMDQAVKHCTAGIGIWNWASNDHGSEPDVVMACCGDVPTLETLAAVELLRKHLPELKVRVINVVNLMKLQPQAEHPHGLSDRDFDALFTTDKPVIFAFHGYPWLIHRLTYRRTNHKNLHVRGYKEEGTTTTPFDMVVRNDLDRFHLVADVIDRVPGLGATAAYTRQALRDKLIGHRQYIERHGEDLVTRVDVPFTDAALGGDDFESSHGSRISASVGLSERWDVGVHYGVDLNEWDALIPHEYDARRDAEHHRTGIHAAWTAEDGRRSLSLGYEYLRNLAEQDDFDYRAHGVSARFFTLVGSPISVGLHLLASYTDADYIHYPVSPKRDARTQLYRARITLPITSKLVAETSYAYLHVGADDGFFRMKRHLVTGALSYHF